MNDLIANFVFFFAVIDPIGTVPVFIAVTTQYEEPAKRRIAIVAVLVASFILLFFVVAGEIILTAINTPISAFQIAGGIVLLIFALTMIFGEGKPEEEVKLATCDKEVAIFPLAVPSLASPGAMLAAVLLTKNQEYTIWQQFQTTMVMFSVLIIALVLVLCASKVQRFIGTSGASIISRVMGVILTSVAVSNILAGIKMYFQI